MSDFDRSLKGYRNSILFRSQPDFVAASTKLYKQLWTFRLGKKIENVVVVQDSKTGGIPFESLLYKKPSAKSTGYSSYDFLLNRYAISYAFSAQLWYNGTKKTDVVKDPSILLFAPIRFKRMANLPGTETEVNEISNLFEAKKFKHNAYFYKAANEHEIKLPSLKNYRYLHLATHGLVNVRKPELSAVFLSADSIESHKDDGILYSGEIYNLDIRADLVTLSACETGLGKVSRGEGIIGLTRALLYAGANNMVVSLWTVSDRSTSELMQDFYAYMLEHPQLGYSASLTHAKKELIHTADFSAPYYWAAFVLIGK
jgi:CHAT domain-containing protein